MSTKLTFIGILGLLLVSFSSHGAPKKTVCSLTFNSSDEIALFKKYLPAKDFDFKELLPSKQEEWGTPLNFNTHICVANRETTKCDILVISGHFGGSFFGTAPWSLPLWELERTTCGNGYGCKNVFGRVKEVFMFGCNTLAGKGQDSRTAEQYIQVLVQDGFSYAAATAMAAFRYSIFGQTNSDRMAGVFKEVPNIYGFNSIGPSGKTVTPILESYLKVRGPNYSTYLDSLLAPTPNTDLAQAFRYTSLVQGQGLGARTESPYCFANSRDRFTEKLNWLNKVLKDGSFVRYIPEIQVIIDDLKDAELTKAETNLLSQIRGGYDWQKILNSVIPKLRTYTSQEIRFWNVVEELAALDTTQYHTQIEDEILAVAELAKQGVAGKLQQLCDMDLHHPILRDNFRWANLEKAGHMPGISTCLGDVDGYIEHLETSQMRTFMNETQIFARIAKRTPEVRAKIDRLAQHGKTEEIRRLAADVLEILNRDNHVNGSNY